MQIQVEQKLNFYIFRLDGRQWGDVYLKSGKGSINLPISANILVMVLQHYGNTPQYNGVSDSNVVSSLKDEEEIRFIAITK